MKSQVRIQFNGDNAIQNAERVYKELSGGMFHNVCLAPTQGLVHVFFDVDVAFRQQLLKLASLLSATDSWTFVGPSCPNDNIHLDHGTQHLSMINLKVRHGEDMWSCFDPRCRKKYGITKVARSSYPLMTYTDFSLALHTSSVVDAALYEPWKGQMIKVSKPYQDHPEKKIDWSSPNMGMTQIPREPRPRDLVKTYLGTNIASLEVAILASMLKVKVPDIDAPSWNTKDNADRIDRGSMMVFHLRDGDKATGANLVDTIHEWAIMQAQSGGPATLLVMDIDDGPIDINLVRDSGGNLRATADQMIRNKVLRQKAKHQSFAIDRHQPAPISVINSLTPEAVDGVKKFFTDVPAYHRQEMFDRVQASDLNVQEAKELVRSLLMRFPEIKAYAQKLAYDQIAMLTTDHEALKEDYDQLSELYNKQKKDLEVYIKELVELKEGKFDTKSDKPSLLATKADEMLRFLASVNFQDHSRAEQREFLEKFSALKNVLREELKKTLQEEGIVGDG